jgi:hypothetical protein
MKGVDDAKGLRGFMLKRGRIVKTWKRRFFQVEGHALCYYNRAPEEGGTLKGQILLTDAAVAHEHKAQVGHPNYFIMVSGKRQLHLSAPTEAGMHAWVAAIVELSMPADCADESTSDRLGATCVPLGVLGGDGNIAAGAVADTTVVTTVTSSSSDDDGVDEDPYQALADAEAQLGKHHPLVCELRALLSRAGGGGSAHEDGGEVIGVATAKCECPGKHTLVPFVTSHAHFACDVCKLVMPEGSSMAGCRTCDFDVCRACIDTHSPQLQAGMCRVEQATTPAGVKLAASKAAGAAAPKRRWAQHTILLLFGPVVAVFDALDGGRLGVLHLVRARLLMSGDKLASSRRALERVAYDRLGSLRTAQVALPLLAALALAFALVTRATPPLATVGAFTATVFTVTLSGAARVLQLPGARIVRYQSDSMRCNSTNVKDVVLRVVSLFQMLGLALKPFSAEIRDTAQRTGAFAAMLREHVFPVLDVVMLAMPGDVTLYWLGICVSFVIVGGWLCVLFVTLKHHDVTEQREALFRRTRLMAIFGLLSSDLFVFTASKLFEAVHCVRDDDGAWQLANDVGACFTQEHTVTMAVALVAMLLYFPTAVLFGSSIIVRSQGRFSDPVSVPSFSVMSALLLLLLLRVFSSNPPIMALTTHPEHHQTKVIGCRFLARLQRAGEPAEAAACCNRNVRLGCRGGHANARHCAAEWRCAAGVPGA